MLIAGLSLGIRGPQQMNLFIHEGQVAWGALGDCYTFAEVVRDELVEGAVFKHCFESSVDGVSAFSVILGQTNTVVLIGEWLAILFQLNDTEVAWGLSRVAIKNGCVSGHGVDIALTQCLSTAGVGVVFLQLNGRQCFLDLLCRGRTGYRAQDLAFKVVQTVDFVVRVLNQKRLVGQQVRTTEVNGLGTTRVNRVSRGNHVDFTVLNQSFTLSRWGFAPVDGRLFPTIFSGNGIDHVGSNFDV